MNIPSDLAGYAIEAIELMATRVRRLQFLPMHSRQIQATGSAGNVVVDISKSLIPVPKSWYRKMVT
jgi:hypothetical protein